MSAAAITVAIRLKRFSINVRMGSPYFFKAQARAKNRAPLARIQEATKMKKLA
jgi:hypothetical protein